MTDTHNLQELPEEWVKTTLGNIVALSDKKVEPSALEEVPYIGLEHIEKDTGSLLGFGKSSDVKSTKSKFNTGDLLYGKLRPYLNKVVCVDFEGVCSTDILVFTKNPCVSNKFLLFRLLSRDFVRYASQNVSGVQHPRVNFQTLSEFPLSLPPLNEQRRLVTKIEALKTRSQRVKDALSLIPALLEQFRQSVLAAAFSGNLTADWREKNPDVEPAEVLLEKIRLERGKRYQEECSKAEIEGRRKPTPFKENLEPIELSNLPTIPDTWCWERLVNISNTIGGVTKGRKLGNRQTIMLPYLRVANVQDGYLDLSEIKEIEVLPEDLDKYHLEYGDILFTEGGDRDKLGRGTIWKNNVEKCIHQNHVYRARLYYSGVSCEYISLVTKSKYAKAYFFANASQTVNLASINLTCLGNLPLAIPSEEEQKEIVHQIQLLFKLADTIEQQYQQSFGAINQLDQSILAEAFRGALVPQDPNDEPASVLLERIRAEREKSTGATFKRGKKSADNSPSQNNKNTGASPKRSNKSEPFKEAIQMELELE